MNEQPSKAQLDKLGDRLRAGSQDESSLRALDEYRKTFRSSYDSVMAVLKQNLNLEGTGRPAKTTTAIEDKLNRQRIRLTQIQDVAGIRVLAESITRQDRVVQRLKERFVDARIDDRREKPSHGYRAIHVIVLVEQRFVEIQVRTEHQQRWAELSEKFADLLDPSIKYGGGPPAVRASLDKYARLIEGWEKLERQHDQMLALALDSRERASRLVENDPQHVSLVTDALELAARVAVQRAEIGPGIREIGEEMLTAIERVKRKDHE